MARKARYGPFEYERQLGARNYTFKSDMDKFVINTDQRMLALVRQSVQDLIDDAQTVGPSVASTRSSIAQGLGSIGRGKKKKLIQGPPIAAGEGGRMRVDTGFLRASGQASLNGMPQGPTRGDPDKTYPYDTGSVILAIGTLQLGATFYFGWTAAYARIREAYDGFLEAAVQKWPIFVARNTETIKGLVK